MIMRTELAEVELMVEAHLPLLSGETRCGFYKFNRRGGDYALAMALVTYRVVNGVIQEPRVGLGGAEDRPRRIVEAEAALADRPPAIESFRAAGDAAADAIEPLEDTQASTDYRRDLVRVVTRRALERAAP
jgi:carbon-monoxide dehydrogenase medium subunit